MENGINDGVMLAARLLLAALFLIFGWRKLTDYSGTVSRMVQDGAPFPALATPYSDLHGASGCVRGCGWSVHASFSRAPRPCTRSEVALIAHRYWTVTGPNKVDSMESFYKNLGIVGGFLLLCITGAGKLFD